MWHKCRFLVQVQVLCALHLHTSHSETENSVVRHPESRANFKCKQVMIDKKRNLEFKNI